MQLLLFDFIHKAIVLCKLSPLARFGLTFAFLARFCLNVKSLGFFVGNKSWLQKLSDYVDEACLLVWLFQF